MYIAWRSIRKWTLITLWCGAHSFFYGILAKGSIPAMALGMATLIGMFAAIDSHPYYRRKRVENELLRQAMDAGIYFRILIAAYIIADYGFMAMGIADARNNDLLIMPYKGELYTGLFALNIVGKLTGADILQGFGNYYTHAPAIEYFATSFLTTLVTGLIHTAALALLCIVFYGMLTLKRRIASQV